MPYGTNRLTQELIDKGVYSAGAASPILKWNNTFYRGSLDGTGFDAGHSRGRRLQAQRPPRSSARPTSGTLPWTAANPAALNGWVTYAENEKKVEIDGSQTIYDKESFGENQELIGQAIATLELSERTQIRNTTTYQFSQDYRYGYDTYQSYMVNKLGTNRTELIHKREFTFLGKKVKWQSNTGVDARYLWNLCDNLGVISGSSEKSATAGDLTNTGTSLGSNYLLLDPKLVDQYASSSGGYIAQILRPAGYNDKNTKLYNAVLTKYGYVQIAKAYQVGSNRWDGVSVMSAGGSDIRNNQVLQGSIFTEHKFDIGDDVTLHVGGRLSNIWQWIKGSPTTYAVRDSGYFPANTNIADSTSANNGDYNASLTYHPTSWFSVYATVDPRSRGHGLRLLLVAGLHRCGQHAHVELLSHAQHAPRGRREARPHPGQALRHRGRCSASNARCPRLSRPSSPLYFPVQLLYNGAEVAPHLPAEPQLLGRHQLRLPRCHPAEPDAQRAGLGLQRLRRRRAPRSTRTAPAATTPMPPSAATGVRPATRSTRSTPT